MATTAERIGVVETRVQNLDEKLDDLKVDVKEMHDCLDKTREGLTNKLNEMYDASCSQHAALAKEISELKSQRDKWVWWVAGVVAAAGWASGHAGISNVGALKFEEPDSPDLYRSRINSLYNDGSTCFMRLPRLVPTPQLWQL